MDLNDDRVDNTSRLPIESLAHYIDRVALPDSSAQEPNFKQIEERRRAQEAEEYQDALHQKFFQNDDNKPPDTRLQLLESLKDHHIRIETTEDFVMARLRPLATKCDTVYTLVESRPLFQQGDGEWVLSLKTYGRDAVKEFVMMIEETMIPTDASPASIVECCQIAHYLQCQSILDDMVSILTSSVDSANCLSLLQLADRLQLPRLFEGCLAHLMASMNNVEALAEEELSFELRDLILTIKSAIQSSVVGNPRVYFSSVQEYLAIFAEMVEYYVERLENAKQGRVTPYTQLMIDKQEKKVHNLECVMREQQALFARQHDYIRKQSPAKRDTS